MILMTFNRAVGKRPGFLIFGNDYFPVVPE